MNTLLAEHEERTLLGIHLLDGLLVPEEAALDPSEYALDSHRTIAAVINSMRMTQSPVNVLTVVHELRRQKRLEDVGGAAYLALLAGDIPANTAALPFASAVREKAAMRRIVGHCTAWVERAKAGEGAEELLHDIQMTAIEEASHQQAVAAVPLSELVIGVVENMKKQRDFQGEVLGIPSGIGNLDHYTTGWRNGELTYLGAMPGRGKTSAMVQAMYNAAKAGFPVGCISLEMRSEQIIKRLGVMHSGLSAKGFRDVRVMPLADFHHATKSVLSLGDLPIYVCDQSGLNPAQITALCRSLFAQGVRIIFIDFVQIIREKGRDREAINVVSAALRDTCKALDIPFVVASQLARRDNDPNRRPTLQDLRESGNLEQDAHNVLMLYRPKDRETNEWSGDDEIIIEKQREGVTGAVPVRYSGKSLTFEAREAR